MTVQMTIIGLGEIGGSFGLALKDQKSMLKRIGFDKDNRIARQAEKLGAIDQIEATLQKAVRDSEIVLLCVPADQMFEMLEIVVPNLKEGAVVMETGLAKQAVADWMSQKLPKGRFYIGITPNLNPAYLHSLDHGLEASRADLFKDSLMVIVAPGQVDTGAVKLASDLARLVGANPLFADPSEVDGLVSASHLLPQLIAAALVNTLSDQPGWRDARKLAGISFSFISEPIMQPSEAVSLRSAVELNQANIVRLMDNFLAEIIQIKENIVEGDSGLLADRLENARKVRLDWWRERQAGTFAGDHPTAVELPEYPGILGRMFGFGQKPRNKK